MNNYTLALIIMGAISVIQMLYGLIRRSKGPGVHRLCLRASCARSAM